MSAFLSSLAAWWVHWGPWIGAALIPTLITGLSMSPKTAPEAAWLQKMWDFVKTAMSYFSVATHKDAPGTFQLPLKLAKLLKKGGTGPAAGLVLVIILSNHACAWSKHEVKVVENGVIDCAQEEKSVIANDKQSLILTVLDVGMQITQALPGGVDAVEQVVVNLIKQYGEPIVACVFDKMKPSTMKPMVDAKDMTIMATISRHNWKFKGE